MSATSELVHLWYRCHACRSAPIVGRRFTCRSCPAGPDNDLCAACYEQYLRGEVRHPAEGSLASAMGAREHVFDSSEGEPRSGFAAWLEPVHPAADDPAVPEHFVVRPEFRAGMQSFIGSYAFVVEVEGRAQPVVLTALHIMDELIKKRGIDATKSNADYSGRELPGVVTKVQLYDVFAVNWVLAELGSAGPMLVLPDARIDDEEPCSHRDIAAFEVHDREALSTGRLAPGRLARRPPEVGEPVWLAAKTQAEPVRRTLKAVVVELTEKTFVLRYEDPALRAPYSSGAPLLDRAGDVVGINAGGGWLDGHRLGHGNHVGSIRRHLSA